MNDASKQAILSILRSALIVVGAMLTSRGILSDGVMQEVIGVVMVAVPAVWGVWDKYQVEAKAKDREVIAVNAGIAKSNAEPSITPPVSAALVPSIIKGFSGGHQQ